MESQQRLISLKTLILVSKVLKEIKVLKVLSDGFLVYVPYTIHNSFKHGEKESNWNIKKLLNYSVKVYHNMNIMKGSLLHQNLIFLSVSVLADIVFSKKFLSIWLKMIEGLDLWRGLPKSNQPGGKQKLLIFTFFDEWSTCACQAFFLWRNKEAQQFSCSCYFPNKFPSGVFYCWFSEKFGL